MRECLSNNRHHQPDTAVVSLQFLRVLCGFVVNLFLISFGTLQINLRASSHIKNKTPSRPVRQVGKGAVVFWRRVLAAGITVCAFIRDDAAAFWRFKVITQI